MSNWRPATSLCLFSLIALLTACGDPAIGTPCDSDEFCGDGICREGMCAPRALPASPGTGPGVTPVDDCDNGLPPGGGTSSHSVGDCAETGWAIDTDPSSGVSVSEDDGAIVLDTSRSNDEVIWIANTGESTVSKFDTRSFEELARYRTGPRGGSRDDPSRTSVNTFGDVYVGNRRGGSVSKISVLGDRCPDTNGDGVVTTSSGPDDVLEWGEDDCVLWNKELDDGGLIRSVAAFDAEGLDGAVFPVVWIGGYDGVIWKLNGDSGEIELETESPVAPYGFALDRSGILWIATRQDDLLGRLDTNQCTDNASCDVDVCDDDIGPGCVKSTIDLPITTYGITVDEQQRVWLGGNDIVRYDPNAPAGSRITEVELPFDDSIVVHGIAADGAGYVWGAAQENGIIRVDTEDPTNWVVVDGSEGYSNKGMAVDADGKIWSVTQEDRALVVTPGPALDSYELDDNVARSIIEPYTYSDMTGQQLRLATNPRGYYRRIFQSCTVATEEGTAWKDLHFDAVAPPGTRLSFRARTADTPAALGTAEYVTIATLPGGRSPVSIGEAFSAAGVSSGSLIEVEAQMEREEGTAPGVTPRVRWMEVTFVCVENPF